MTANQKRAIELAQDVIEGRARARDLSDRDWSLLLLASGMNCSTGTIPVVVCCRVLENAAAGHGYFEGLEPAEVEAQVGEAGGVNWIEPDPGSSFGADRL